MKKISFRMFKKHCAHYRCMECNLKFEWQTSTAECTEANCPVFKKLKEANPCKPRTQDTRRHRGKTTKGVSTMKKWDKEEKRKVILYLDYVNNFLSVAVFAEHYHFTVSEADKIIIDGRTLLIAE